MTRKLLLATVLFLGLASALIYAFRGPLSLAVAERVAAQRLAHDALDTLPDGLHIALCGAGSPFPDDRRAGPCTLVIAGKRMIVIDAGSGSARNLGKMGFNPGRIEAILLTHFHSDHLDGLGELMLQRWVSGANASPLPLHGPTGVEKIAEGLMLAYRQDAGYRVAHHGDTVLPASGFGAQARGFAFDAQGRAQVLQDNDLQIEAFTVPHEPVDPAVGYRIRYKDRIAVISGDTKASPVVQREAKGADLLVHEALSPTLMKVLEGAAGKAGRPKLQKLFADVVDYHTTPAQAAQIAQAAGVGYLLLNHIAPALPLPGMESAFLGDAGRNFQGPIRVGIDGDMISLPAGSRSITHHRRF